MQFVADITGAELAVTDVPESSALGAAMMGMLGLGWVGAPSDFASLPRSLRTFRPRMLAADVDRLVRGWRDAVRRVELTSVSPSPTP
jgi:glycerol kinase